MKIVHSKKLAEFNFKVLHNIVPSGYMVSKWDKTVKSTCDYCDLLETTEHMLFSCTRIQTIWRNVSKTLKFEISWKVLVCGFIDRDITEKLEFLNLIITILMYSIFKQNSMCKFDQVSYATKNVQENMRLYLCYYKNILQCTKYGIYSTKILDDIINGLCI